MRFDMCSFEIHFRKTSSDEEEIVVEEVFIYPFTPYPVH